MPGGSGCPKTRGPRAWHRTPPPWPLWPWPRAGRTSGLRILPQTEWRLQPRTGGLKRDQGQPLHRRRGRAKRLDADDDKRIARLYGQGKATVNELAVRYHVSAGTIYNSLKRTRKGR